MSIIKRITNKAGLLTLALVAVFAVTGTTTFAAGKTAPKAKTATAANKTAKKATKASTTKKKRHHKKRHHARASKSQSVKKS
jgi:hypothetical protein